MRVAIVGGGFAGLVAARRFSRKALQVHLYEKAPTFGGMAASFQWDGVPLDRFYHFLCRGDQDLIDLIDDLGLSPSLQWRHTTMGLNRNGVVYPFGAPWDFLRLPLLGFGAKIRFGVGVLRSSLKRSWKDLEDQKAEDWLRAAFGTSGYALIHEPLLRLKFGAYAQDLSAAWMWARIHRLGRSRRGLLFREILGYVEGGSGTVVSALCQDIEAHGGLLRSNCPVDRIELQDGAVRAIHAEGERIPVDAVLSTVPLPLLRSLVSPIPPDFLRRIEAVPYIGVVCVLIRMAHGLSPHFWTNISDPRSDLAGIIEYTRLDPKPGFQGEHLLYLPRYLAWDDPVSNLDDASIMDHAVEQLCMLYPGMDPSHITDWRVFRSAHAQPICRTGFTEEAVEIRSPIRGLYLTDSCLLHPSDRTLSDTVALAETATERILKDRPLLTG